MGSKEKEELHQNSTEDPCEVRLDPNGRICFDGFMNYDFRSFPEAFTFPNSKNLFQSIVKDCEIAFTARAQQNDGGYSTGNTFFHRACDEPRCTLEKLAKQIFDFHTKDADFDREKSGAEWWTLYIEGEDEVGFHFDKDYGMESYGINVYPHVGTVTYLSTLGGSTLMFEKPGPLLYGGELSGPVDKAFLSFPKIGKHVCFDGRFLHAAPVEIGELWDQQKNMSHNVCTSLEKNTQYRTITEDVGNTEKSPRKTKGAKATRKRQKKDPKRQDKKYATKRITFLVNIWLNHKPLLSEPFPEQRISRLSNLVLPPQTENPWEEEIPPEIHISNANKKQKNSKKKTFSWSFSGENHEEHSVTAPIPVERPSETFSGTSFSLKFDKGLNAFVD
mmetsp:Transcript_5825/g.7997  ORF Transcript_5825/g.7997 Transcript_5825/m.7997 type:complete len:389 (+) Transcript_5825:90-1256(+)